MLREGHQSLWGETEDICQNLCAPQEVGFLPHMPGMNAELALSAWGGPGPDRHSIGGQGGSTSISPSLSSHHWSWWSRNNLLFFWKDSPTPPPHLIMSHCWRIPTANCTTRASDFLKKRQKLQVLKIVACTRRLQIHDKNPQKVTTADSSGECCHVCPVWLRYCVLAGEFIQESY